MDRQACLSRHILPCDQVGLNSFWTTYVSERAKGITKNTVTQPKVPLKCRGFSKRYM